MKCKLDIKNGIVKTAVDRYKTANIVKFSNNSLYIDDTAFPSGRQQGFRIAQSVVNKANTDFQGIVAYVSPVKHGHEIVFAPSMELVDTYYNEYLLKVNTEQARQMLAEDAQRAGEEFDDNYLFQVEDLWTNLAEVNKRLLSINKVVKSIGSSKKLDEALKRAGMHPEFRKQFIKLVEDNPQLREFNITEVLAIYTKEYAKNADRQYYEAVQQPLDRELEDLLINYFSDFKIKTQELDNLKEKFGVDSVGVFDVLAKTIFYAKNRNLLTIPEEFGHVYVELLGSISKQKADNPLFTFMFRNIDKWDGYDRVFNQYKDIYKTADGLIDIYKIKKEAIGQAIGIALVRNYKVQKGDNGFWETIQKIIDFLSNLLSKLSYTSIEREADLIAKEILSGSKEKLQRYKADFDKFNLLSYKETIEMQNKKDNGLALSFMKWYSDNGNIITGSLAYRLQGTVFRPEIDALHDIDMIVPADIHKLDLTKRAFLSPEQFEMDQMYRKLIAEERYVEAKQYKIKSNVKLQLEDVVDRLDYFKEIKEKYPDLDFLYTFFNQKANAYYVTVNAIWSKDQSLKDKFKSLSGSFNERLKHFTPEEIDQIYLFDFFLRPETSDQYVTVPDVDYNLRLAHFNYAFYEKLNMMGRPKDAYDYQMWEYFDDSLMMAPDFNDRLVYYQALDSGSITNVKLENEGNVLEDLNDLNFNLDSISYLYSLSSKSMDIQDYGKQVQKLAATLQGIGYNNQDILDKIKCL